jgi:hypothetical protein
MRYSDSGNGITADSIAFYRDHQHQLGPIATAELRFPGFDDPPDPYLMVLRDPAGDEIRLSGCTTGYPGEGPRGAMLVLLEAGWSVEEARQVFSAATLRLTRGEPPATRTAVVAERPSGPDAAQQRRRTLTSELERS